MLKVDWQTIDSMDRSMIEWLSIARIEKNIFHDLFSFSEKTFDSFDCHLHFRDGTIVDWSKVKSMEAEFGRPFNS
jgi:hypothetical protein